MIFPNACTSDVGIPGFATLLLFLAVLRHDLFSYQWGIYHAYLLILMEVSGLYTLRQYIHTGKNKNAYAYLNRRQPAVLATRGGSLCDATATTGNRRARRCQTVARRLPVCLSPGFLESWVPNGERNRPPRLLALGRLRTAVAGRGVRLDAAAACVTAK